MLKSMYSGISGMKANQTKMDVVGNNVANVGTTAFKKSSTRFTDTLNQSVIYASAPGTGVGGVNPGQVGMGTKVSGIFKNMLQGAIQPTGRPTDLAIDGDGFFVIDMKDDKVGYTRDGSFSLDKDGCLVTAEGYYVKDNNNDKITIPKEAVSFNVAKDGKISYAKSDGTRESLNNPLQIVTFQNSEGLEALSGNLYGKTTNSGDPETANGLINQGAIEMSNVDLAEEFTEMMVTTRAFQAASKIITTSDELLQEIINLKR